MPLVTRKYGPTAKGSKLSIQEMDGNLLYLDDLIKNPPILPSDYIDFNDVTVSPPAYSAGRIFYADGSLNAYIDESDITLQIGQEFWVKVRNSSGSDITDGKVVYISGAQGQAPKVELAQANSVNTSFTLGVSTHTIENNSFGYITIEGRVNGINTTGGAENWNDGDEVYLSATTPGALTNIKPAAPNADVTVGTVINASNNGSLLVSVTEPTAINDITEINVTAPNDGDVLRFNSSTSVWENTSSFIRDSLLCLYDAGDYDVATNTWPDSSGNGFGTATLQNPGAGTTPTKVTIGTGAPYLECNDTHMLVDKTASPWTQFSYTQEVWINFTGNSSFSGITDFYPGEEYALYWGGAGAYFPADSVIMSVDGVDAFPTSGGASLSWGGGPTGWYHIVTTFTGNTLTIYLNGEPSVTSTGDTDIGIGPGLNAELDLLCAHEETSPAIYGFEGNCGLIGIYTRALNAAEVKQNFNANRLRFGL